MNEEQKDNGLKRAVKRENEFRLPSNFTYRTMRKVEEAIRLREKVSERRALFATITASVFLIGCCIAGLTIYFGDTIREAFTPATPSKTDNIQIPAFCILIFTVTPLFVLFDRWMRRRYFKHHS
ncbi:hypothetical protein [Bacteroides sp. UBA939]|uniref:hypothetical protein n=1 Tax=Bacteroides sp. UBA939 TaxID=1946092 RepID=UPI0025C696CA|nr:hypothetical protein [Bacteroides sp. UBA939]